MKKINKTITKEGLLKYFKIAKIAQISFEFILIFGIVFLVITGFIYLITNRISEISQEKENQEIINLINDIKNEIIIASSMHNNYYREFELPTRLMGYEYTLNLSNDEITLIIFDKYYLGGNKKVKKTYNSILPTFVKGNFAEKINETTNRHCITKSDKDGIRISKNQASLESKQSNIYSKYDVIVNENNEFDLYLNLYCVNNLRSIQITIKYDPNFISLERTGIITSSSYNENSLFDSVFVVNLDNSHKEINSISYPLISPSEGRFSLGVIGNECASGSGSIAKLTFKAKNVNDDTETNINFDELFGDSNLRLLDCNFNAYSIEDLPDTKKGALILIKNVN
ncbi:MAG: cohesin domain-containing protein [Candidatus Woesearchaeota archaeon]